MIGVMTSRKPNKAYWTRRKDCSLRKIWAPDGWKRWDPGLYEVMLKRSRLVPSVRWSVEGIGGLEVVGLGTLGFEQRTRGGSEQEHEQGLIR